MSDIFYKFRKSNFQQKNLDVIISVSIDLVLSSEQKNEAGFYHLSVSVEKYNDVDAAAAAAGIFTVFTYLRTYLQLRIVQ